MCEELRSLRLGVDVAAMALEKGNARNYSEEQLYDEITQVIALFALCTGFPPSFSFLLLVNSSISASFFSFEVHDSLNWASLLVNSLLLIFVFS